MADTAAPDLRAIRGVRKERHRAVPLLPETRHRSADQLEIRDIGGSGDEVDIEGLWARYDVGYVVQDEMGEFEETMAPGMAGDLLTVADCRFLIDHDPSRLLARTVSGTLRLTDSPEGPRMTARVNLRDTDARNLVIRLQRGDVNSMSCGFVVARDQWNDAMDQRTIYRLKDLLDVSAVTYPASRTTSVQIAQRMALEMPIESRARVRRLYADLRAGKVLSQGNQDKLVAAAKTLHEVLDGAGYDPKDLIGDEDFEDDDTADDEPTADVGDDGTEGGPDDSDEDGGVDQDGSGVRSDDPGESIRAVKLNTLRVQMEARKHRRLAA